MTKELNKSHNRLKFSKNEVYAYNKGYRVTKDGVFYGLKNNIIINYNKAGYNRVSTKKDYIYIIKGKEYYKIGYTTNFKKRIKQYKTHNPNVNTICLVKSPKAFELENYFHKLYKDKNVDGEWFNLTEEEVISTTQKLYKETQKYFGISSSGTLHYILNKTKR